VLYVQEVLSTLL